MPVLTIFNDYVFCCKYLSSKMYTRIHQAYISKLKGKYYALVPRCTSFFFFNPSPVCCRDTSSCNGTESEFSSDFVAGTTATHETQA